MHGRTRCRRSLDALEREEGSLELSISPARTLTKMISSRINTLVLSHSPSPSPSPPSPDDGDHQEDDDDDDDDDDEYLEDSIMMDTDNHNTVYCHDYHPDLGVIDGGGGGGGGGGGRAVSVTVDGAPLTLALTLTLTAEFDDDAVEEKVS